MMNIQQHIALPWHLMDDEPSCIKADCYSARMIVDCTATKLGTEIEEANAAFIVRAVNAHDALVAALKFLLKHGKSDNISKSIACVEIAEKALAKAEGRS